MTVQGLPGGTNGKYLAPANAGDIRSEGLIPGLEEPLEEGIAAASILAWETLVGFQSIESKKVGHY